MLFSVVTYPKHDVDMRPNYYTQHDAPAANSENHPSMPDASHDLSGENWMLVCNFAFDQVTAKQSACKKIFCVKLTTCSGKHSW